jgi:hypothetical protein
MRTDIPSSRDARQGRGSPAGVGGRSILAAVGVLVALSACGGDHSGSDITGPAPDQPVLAFDDDAAVRANGNLPSADPKTVCGSSDRGFLSEFVQGSLLHPQVPFRLADINHSPSEVMVSGAATNVSLVNQDFPPDHTFGSDFTMDVVLDQPYEKAAQQRGVVGGALHAELSEGQLPHVVQPAGPPTGELWEAMAKRAQSGIQTSFVPDQGSRTLVMGNWVVDCGHQNYQTELHPISFMAVARLNGGATVVDAFYNPYRETQRYHPDSAKALAFDDPSRFTDPGAGPFPNFLFTSLARLQDRGPPPYQSLDSLEIWAMLEPNTTSPVAWRVCAPPGSTGADLEVSYHWITRPGVQIEVTADRSSSCAVVRSSLATAQPAVPSQRVCVIPWDSLSEAAGEEAGIAHLDLIATLGAFLAPQFRSRLAPSPIQNCYDPLSGPALESEPAGQRVEVSEDLLIPFYGTIAVRRK